MFFLQKLPVITNIADNLNCASYLNFRPLNPPMLGGTENQSLPTLADLGGVPKIDAIGLLSQPMFESIAY